MANYVELFVKKHLPAESPDAYVDQLVGWRRQLVESLRSTALSLGALTERVKWGHLVYFSGGPVLLVRAEEARVIFGFWRGKRLQHIHKGLRPSGKYELANIFLTEGDCVDPAEVQKLIRAAIALNQTLGDPTDAARHRNGFH